MIRTCDGTDVNLLDDPATHTPCGCGLTFDDVDRSTIYPHEFLPTPEQKAQLARWLDTVEVEDIVNPTPDTLARLAHILMA